MTERIARSVALILLGAVGPTLDAQNESTASRLTVPQIVERVTPSTVAISGLIGFGSGVVVSTDGFIVTNHHVVDGQDRLRVKFPNQTIYYEAKRVTDAPGRDLALLRIDAANLTAATFGDADNVSQGETVVVIGNPAGLTHTVSNGILTGFEIAGQGMFGVYFPSAGDRVIDDGTKILQTNADISPGSSGGGMFNGHAELIGIMTATLTVGQNLNFAIPVNYVREIIRTGRPDSVENAAATNVNRGNQEPLPSGASQGRTRSWRTLLVFLPIIVLLIAWFVRQQQEGS